MSKQKIIVGVSGGVDSCYLLFHLINQGLNLVVCHVNHNLRPEAEEDAIFVRNLAQTHKLPYEEKTLDLSGHSSFETAARHERLLFFAETARQYETDTVALGHHMNDQAETILMQLCRGSSEPSGMREHTPLIEYGITVWRPLLKHRKTEIETQMRQNQQPWREDATNHEPIAARNRVRNEVIPLLNDIFSRDIIPPLTRSSQGESSELIKELIEQLEIKDLQGRLFLPKLAPLSENLQSRILFDYLKKEGIGDLSTKKLHECLQLIDRPEVSKVNLPSGHFLRRKEQRIFVEKTRV